MSRLAFLPDSSTLAGLCQKVRTGNTLGRAAKPLPRAARSETSLHKPVAPITSAGPRTPRPEARRLSSDFDGPSLNAKTLPPSADSLLSEMDHRLEDTDSLDRRFSHLVQWLETQASARAVFITDAEGLSMAESNAREGYMAAAGELGVVIKNLLTVLPDVEEGSTTLLLKGGGNVELLWCETRLGRFAIGLVLDRPLEPFWSKLIPSALQKVLALNV
jgi:hypothetical protein